MRIYFFSTDTGIYAGESFENADKLDCMEGITTISPPCYERGHVPVFDNERNAWDIVRVDIVNHAPILHCGTTDEK